ncbi:hypothetical protein Pint_04773 [Pistacia integerrima]|uniref:Uncharacterized protein n=1 Tax=Pistacia integerrima TaxID=434235 RepID=A0ACC0Z7P4_9ROSI|nr:hypothetical protein Pint_04773 [Pistacia integerrima]
MPQQLFLQSCRVQNFQVKLGQGGFGSVFQGILEDGTKVAVKRLGSDVNQGKKEFLSEIKTIGSIHHFNLNHKEDAVQMIQVAISCLQTNLYRRPSASVLVKVFEGLSTLEPVTDYSFLNTVHEEFPQEARAGDSSPITASVLSGPR